MTKVGHFTARVCHHKPNQLTTKGCFLKFGIFLIFDTKHCETQCTEFWADNGCLGRAETVCHVVSNHKNSFFLCLIASPCCISVMISLHGWMWRTMNLMCGTGNLGLSHVDPFIVEYFGFVAWAFVHSLWPWMTGGASGTVVLLLPGKQQENEGFR